MYGVKRANDRTLQLVKLRLSDGKRNCPGSPAFRGFSLAPHGRAPQIHASNHQRIYGSWNDRAAEACYVGR
jgi:hypothetical protein